MMRATTMKITPILLTLPFVAGFAFADEKEKPAAAKEAAPAKEAVAEEKADKPAPAAGSWEAVEAMLKGPPQQRAKTREEAEAVWKEYFAEFEKATEEFTKANPKDARRWKVALHNVRFNGARQALKISPKTSDEVKKMLGEIVAADDADEETKGQASFMQVMESKDNAEEFAKLAEAHKKAYPKLQMNQMIDRQMKTIESEKALKEKPIEMSFKATNGTEVDLSKMRGKVVLIDFWATWCGPCVAEIPNVVKSYNALHGKGFEIVGISFDKEGDEEKLAKFTKDKEMPWPQYFDGKGWQNEFGTKYGINSIPRMWLVDKKGMVVDTDARKDLEKKVEKLLAE